jgi:hypothetical protein
MLEDMRGRTERRRRGALGHGGASQEQIIKTDPTRQTQIVRRGRPDKKREESKTVGVCDEKGTKGY